MTENKRFTFEIKTQDNRAYTQWYDNGKPINSAETIVNLLNELSEENRKLKEVCKKYGIELKDIPKILDWADSTLQGEYDSSLSEWND